MSLFMNNGDHPGIYKNGGKIEAVNQEIAEFDYFSELLKTQRASNEALHESFGELKSMLGKMGGAHMKEFSSLYKGLSSLQSEHEKKEQRDSDMIMQLKKTKLSERQLREKLDAHFTAGQRTEREMILSMKRLEKSFSQLADQQRESMRMHEAAAEKLNRIEESEKNLLGSAEQLKKKQEELSGVIEQTAKDRESLAGRLDSQEALTEKILRQLHELRSAIFERSSDLAEKIEKGAALTVSSIQRIFPRDPHQLLLARSLEEPVEERAEKSTHDS